MTEAMCRKTEPFCRFSFRITSGNLKDNQGIDKYSTKSRKQHDHGLLENITIGNTLAWQSTRNRK
jgi:hypothetical protein